MPVIHKEQSYSVSDLAEHQGVFRRRMSLFEGVALMMSGTIGAGVLGLPYAIAQSGILIGVGYILGIGLLMMSLNLMLGEVAVRTNGSFQLVGFAKKYLGPLGGAIMTFMMYGMLFGALVIYLIGEGNTLSALFGGSSFVWTLVFFGIAGICVIRGLRTVKTAEVVLMLGILCVVLCIVVFSVPHIDIDHLMTTNLPAALFPYGVVLFALHGTTAIPEMHSLMRHDPRSFKRAVWIGGISVMAVYLLFAAVVVGVTGVSTTEIATIGLGQTIGKTMFVFGNVFAFFAMATSFLLTGVALRDSLSWDYRLGARWATLLTLGVPLVIFLLGLRGFVSAIDIVGGVFGSIEMLLILLIYWRAKTAGDIDPGTYRLHHIAWVAMLLLVVLSFGAVYSVWSLW